MAEELPQLWQNYLGEREKAVGTPIDENPDVFTKTDVLKWQILAGMSHYRIDPSIIQVKDTPNIKGGRGIVFPAKFIDLPETRTASTLLPGTRTAPFLEEGLAVKKLIWNRDDDRDSTKFFKYLANELSLMATLSHPNVIQLIGFVEDVEKGDAWIIVPWAENGNVREFLQSGGWDIPERVSLIQDVACGLEYLHTREPPICHGDLKSLNILVNSSYQAVITDFGTARIRRSIASLKENQLASPNQILVNDSNFNEVAGWTSPEVKFNPATSELTLTGPTFSLRWTAPEVLSGEEQDLTSDMWSIGWICWEIGTGRIPFQELNTETAIIMHTTKGKLPQIREDAHLSLVLQLCSLMSDCWQKEPAKRVDVSTFRRKVRFVPSVTPSGLGADGQKTRPAALLLELGRMYSLQNDTAQAKSYYLSAFEVAGQTKNDTTKGDALIGLGEVYNACSRFQEAEQSFMESHDIHSRIGNDLGTANALVGLGEIYNARSKYQDAEKAFSTSHEIHSRIGNDLGAANALVGLGENFSTRSRYQEAEDSFTASHEIHSRIGNDLGVADTLVGLGKSYNACSRYQEAEKAFKASHEIYSLIGNDLGAANALVGLGEIYNARSRYQDAEKAFSTSHEIYSLIGNDLGAANALVGLGENFSTRSRYQEAEDSFTASHKIHSRIGNDLGVADTLVGLGKSYNACSRYQEAEKTFKASHEFYSQIGNDLGVANALVGLGEGYSARSRHQEAEKAFKEAYDIHSRIGSNIGVANALMGLGEIYTAQSRYEEAKNAFKQAREIYSQTGSQVGLAKAGILLYETGNAQLNSSEADEAFNEVPEILSRLENEISPKNALNPPEKDCDTQSIYSEDEEAREDHCPIEDNAKAANAPEEAPPSLVADTQPDSRLQEEDLFDEPTMSAQIAALATEDVFEMIQALEKVAPKAVRNKHKTYSILRISRDICKLIIEIGDPPECQTGIEVKPLLTRTEDYCALLDALEETLLDLAEILHSDMTTSAADLYSSWSQSRFAFVGILTKLCQPPFPDAASHTQDIADDLFFDDCSWLSRLIRRVVQPEISSQIPDVPRSHPLYAVTDGLQYLETQVKCRVPDGPTRELIIDIATLLAQTLASISAEGDDESRQEQSSLYSEADRDWLFQALADSFSVLHLDSTLQPSTARELAIKWADVRAGFILRCPNALGN